MRCSAESRYEPVDCSRFPYIIFRILLTDSRAGVVVKIGQTEDHNMKARILAGGRRKIIALTLGLLGSAGWQAAHAQPLEDFRDYISLNAFALQEDGRILGTSSGSVAVRLNRDGTPDLSFQIIKSGNSVRSLAVQDDQTILAGGYFKRQGATNYDHLARLSADGRYDGGFVFTNTASPKFLAILADGKILACSSQLKRFNHDGSLDGTFSCPLKYIDRLALSPDGKIVAFGSLLTSFPEAIYRLNADGSLDDAFNVTINGALLSLAAQPDGKVLAAGISFLPGGQYLFFGLARFNLDGSLDPSFHSGTNDPSYIESITQQADGKILIGGSITIPGQPGTGLARLNADGSYDTNFPSFRYLYARDVQLQSDGRLLINGMVGAPVSGSYVYNTNVFIRLPNTEPAIENLVYSGTTLTWWRGGTSPEVWRTSFDYSTNGIDWVNLGAGTRIAGGWNLTGVVVTANVTLRARGYVTSGTGSSWFVESTSGPPVITRQPLSLTNDAGTAVNFSSWGGGTPPLSYRWLKNGLKLDDGGNFSGTHTPTLAVSNLLTAQAGQYSMVLSNTFGSVTSAVASLTIREPVIVSQPQSQEVDGGQTVLLSLGCVGTAPLNYQWRKDGVELPGATNSTLILTNIGWADAGNYDAIATNAFGAATSSLASLIVNTATLESWYPEVGAAVDWAISAFAEQADGKTLVSGSFQSLNGQACPGIVRFNPDGLLDSTFNPTIVGTAAVYCAALAIQPDDRLVAGGMFIDPSQSIGVGALLDRLNPDGSLDSTFNPAPSGISSPTYSLAIYSLQLLPENQLLVGGRFEHISGQYAKQLVRMNVDGLLDTNYNASWLQPSLECVMVQPDSKVWVKSSYANRLMRLGLDGSPELNLTLQPADAYIEGLQLQPDGKILLAGSFSRLTGQSCSNLARIYPDGTLDSTFAPFRYGEVTTIALQADGKIIAMLNAPYGESGLLKRFNSDGTEDPSFIAYANGYLSTIALQSDGRILVGGYFSRLAGHGCTNLGRLKNPDPAIQSLTCDGATVTWLRGGSAPEVWRTTFESSTDGVNWASLGDGRRISGGWTVTNLTLPPSAKIRARGYVTGGRWNGSSWWVESQTNVPPLRLGIAASTTNSASSTVTPKIRLSGPMGCSVVIEVSSDLKQWTPLTTNRLDQGEFEFHDLETNALSRRFYRAVYR